jgi:hypothetical protein
VARAYPCRCRGLLQGVSVSEEEDQPEPPDLQELVRRFGTYAKITPGGLGRIRPLGGRMAGHTMAILRAVKKFEPSVGWPDGLEKLDEVVSQRFSSFFPKPSQCRAH